MDKETFEHDDLKINFRGMPTLTDGKVKVMWSSWVKKAMSNCLICRAGPKELAKRHGKFKPNRDHFKFGVASLHVRMCAFLWLCKSYLYQDIKAYAKSDADVDDPLIKQRMDELKEKFLDRLNLPVYQVQPGLV